MLTHLFLTASKRARACALAVLFAISSVGAADSPLLRLEDGVNELIYRASRSIVTVEAIQPRMYGGVGGAGGQTIHTLVSSGLIYDSAGHVLASASSVAGREQILVHYDDQTLEARLCGVDYITGLAVLAVDRPLGVPAALCRHRQCAGQMVIAIGNAYGVRASPTLGFCSGLRNDGIMQFTAPITSGTVGGGVFDMAGELVGVITGGIGRERFAEVGLAVPASEIPEAVAHLVAQGDRYAGYVGVQIADIDVSPGLEIRYPASLVESGRTPGRIIDRGVLVTSVTAGSPAARAGLSPGDLLFAVNGVAVGSAGELRSLVRNNPPGTRVEIGYLRREMPYVVALETARLDDPRWEDLFAPQPGVSDPAEVTDSLRKEVERLQRALEDLQKRLR